MRKVVAVVAFLGMVVAGCASSTPSAHAPSSTSAASTSAASTSTTPTTTQPGALQVIAGSATGTSPCEQAAPTPASPGEVGAGSGGGTNTVDVVVAEHGARGMVKQRLLTHAQRIELEQQMEQARTVVTRYPTVATALAAGYVESTPYVPCIGAHYTDIRLAGSFDPSTPSELLYDGTAPDAKIVGLSYLVYHHNGPPPGFAGANDHWHQHNANGGLCLRGALVVGGEDTSPQRCAKLGGRKTLLLDIWMLHAWAVPGFECSWGVFSGECPELGGRLGGTAWETPEVTKAQPGDPTGG